MEDEENSGYEKIKFIQELLEACKMPDYNKRNASELFYTMSELGFFDGMSLNPDDSEIIFKAFVISSVLNTEEIDIIKM